MIPTDNRITLTEASRISGLSTASLRQACHRYSNGRGGLQAELVDTSRGAIWYTTHEWLSAYLTSDWQRKRCLPREEHTP